jgi:carboxypeptidase family protein
MEVRTPADWACSAVGSAPEWHSGGHRFDPGQVHHTKSSVSSCSVRAIFLSCILLAPAWARAQASIAGVVRDASGAALAGVTVAANSSELSEQPRSVATDREGRYAIVGLSPATFSVTFRLDGFNAVRWDGIELTGSMVATVNAELPVGAVNETVIVKGDIPLVDVHSTVLQASMTSEIISAIPTGRSLVNLGSLIPGMTTWSPRNQTDVGGTNNLQNIFMAIHGGRISDQRTSIDGIPIRNIQGEGYNPNFTPDVSSAQEITIGYGAGTADAPTGGVQSNYVPRDGANRLSASVFATVTGSPFQANNLTPQLIARGMVQPDSLELTYDVNPSGGGPIVADRLWFYTAMRAQANRNYVGGVFENRNAGKPDVWTYEPAYDRPGRFAIAQQSGNLRLTYQPTPRNRFSLFYERQWRDWDEGTMNRSPEAFSRFRFPHNQIAIAGWSAPLSTRWLLEARGAYHAEVWRNVGGDPLLPNNRSLIPVLEQGGAYPGLMYRAKSGVYAEQSMPFIKAAHTAVSYVTGGYTLTTGLDVLSGTDTNRNTFNDTGLQYRFNNGVPNQITEIAAPYELAWRVTELGAYAQNRWSMERLTLNVGMRFDYYGTTFPPSHLGPAPLLPDRNLSFPETSWYRLKDVSPRLGVAYDVFGDGRTALKATAGRYALALSPVTGHPVTNLPLAVTRSWSDADSDYTPDCDIRNPGAHGECGAISDLAFGGVGPSTSYDPRILSGWNVRPLDWEFSVGAQHEVSRGLSVSATYLRRVYGNFTVLDNRATTSNDYTPFSVEAPADPRLPSGGGYVVGGFFDLNPEKRGAVDNFVTAADRYGRQKEHWNGVDVIAAARLRNLLASGGISTGRTSTDICGVAAALPEALGMAGNLGTRPVPLSLDQCHVDTKFLTQLKGIASYTIHPIGVGLAATFQSSPGQELQANYVATNAVVQPSLGRPLSGTAANTTVTLLRPGVEYADRLNQLDARVSKFFHLQGARTALNLDMYNLFNASPVTVANVNYAGTGSTWLQPQSVLPGRLFKVSAQFDF